MSSKSISHLQMNFHPLMRSHSQFVFNTCIPTSHYSTTAPKLVEFKELFYHGTSLIAHQVLLAADRHGSPSRSSNHGWGGLCSFADAVANKFKKMCSWDWTASIRSLELLRFLEKGDDGQPVGEGGQLAIWTMQPLGEQWGHTQLRQCRRIRPRNK